MKEFGVPKEVLEVVTTLQKEGFAAYLVGGCTRDLFLGKKPKDWDVTTNATPEKIQELFPHTFYENEYGTVGVVNEEVVDETLKVVEVTPYRIEEKYSDKRRPDAVRFTEKLEDDLKRRDFTVNAIAYDPVNRDIFDFFHGEQDLKDKIIRAVGKSEERFDEDALRMMRAIRLAAELGFAIETDTGDAISKLAANIELIAKERVQDEFSHLLMSPSPMQGIQMLHEHGLLKYVAPELEEGIGVEQNGDHIYDVWEHNLRAVQHAAEREWPLHVRLAALFHDVAKPETRQWSDEKKDWTFYGHDVVGGRQAKNALQRLKYSNDIIETVAKLVRWHLFFSDIDQITLSAVRRLVRNVGPENVWDLMKVRACDRIGMGRPKEKPYRLRKYESMIEEATRAPVTVGMLTIDGARIMELGGETPGPRIGWVLHALLEEVLDDPTLNTAENLEARVVALSQLSDIELKKLGEAGKEKRLEEEEKEISEIRKRHGVK
ncbi:MAG: HD domain-containing protein [Parcubacteria group bacterium]|nr:HD domain-containing protein [Parcubacteria group bacterium]